MERIIWESYPPQPSYVFDQRYAVRSWDDGLHVSFVADWYQNKEVRTDPRRGPYIHLNALTLEAYRHLVLNNRLPISIKVAGPATGSVNLRSGYGAADLGPFQRKIVSQEIAISIDSDVLALDFLIEASPVDPATAFSPMSKEDTTPKTFDLRFRFPLEIVPEFLNFSARERVYFLDKIDAA